LRFAGGYEMTGNKGCDTCAHKAIEAVDDGGKRIVDCAINRKQIFSPLVDECKRHRAK